MNAAATVTRLLVLTIPLLTSSGAILFPAISNAKPGDPIYIIYEIAPLKLEPHFNAETTDLLQKGQKVSEIHYRGSWVMVATEKGETGWVLNLSTSRQKPKDAPVIVDFSSEQKVSKREEREPIKTPAPTVPPVLNVQLGAVLYVATATAEIKSSDKDDSKTVTRLKRGHKLINLGGSNGWIEVGIHKLGGLTGWISVEQISTEVPTGRIERYKTKEFIEFEKAFWKLHRTVENGGFEFWSDVEYMGDGIIQVTATSTWLSGTLSERRSNLQTLYNLWEAAESTGLPIAVFILDGNGEIRMKQNTKNPR